jgi:hypothetical protein
MNLIDANPELQDPAKLNKWVLRMVKESSAIEGIHHPFAKGKHLHWPQTMEELVKYWKDRVAKDRLARKKKASRAVRSRGSSQRG